MKHTEETTEVAQTDDANAELESLKAQKAKPKYEPVSISGMAHKALSAKFREWSGWHDGAIEFTDPDFVDKNAAGSTDIAATDMNKHRCLINAAALIRNPNRVLNTVTPFRLKQEAVMTGVILHEAGHARFTHWAPHTEEMAERFRHGDGTEVHAKTLQFALMMEEARVEGQMATDARKIGAGGLEWTMRASAAHLLPMTKVSDNDAQAVMDIIGSWTRRAGRMHAMGLMPSWVQQFDEFLETTIEEWLNSQAPGAAAAGKTINPANDTQLILQYLQAMVACVDHVGPTMPDYARDVLELLYPLQDPDDTPSADAGIHAVMAGDADGEGDGEESDPDDAIQAAITQFEDESNEDAKEEQAEQQNSATPDESAPEQKGRSGLLGGRGRPNNRTGYRDPTKDEREIQRAAERFLRTLIAPTESSRVTVSSSPSATVDPIAYSAWKDSGMVREPKFFKTTRRSIAPALPVKIAVLVDISGSMEMMQEPSAVMSWALAAAALDLQNFAGRGQQIESCLIHWGDAARVSQAVGEHVPGIRTVRCNEGTSAMHKALELVEEQMPGFFTPDGKSNRLIVQFTDWQLAAWGGQTEGVDAFMHRAAAAGINMLSIMPHTNKANLTQQEKAFDTSRGQSVAVVLDRKNPAQVWEQSAKLLGGN